MDVMTEDGIEITCLPDCAVCKISMENPLFMDECPLCQFDILGLRCQPGECEYYDEPWGTAKATEDDVGISRCECGAELLSNECGDMPDRCPKCGYLLDWSFYEKGETP